MATSKKGGKKTPKKSKARTAKKSRPKAALKKKTGSFKTIRKAKPKAGPKKKASAAKKIKKAPAKPKAKAVKKAAPKKAAKSKAKALPKPKKARVTILEEETTIAIVMPASPTARMTRGEATISDTTLDRLYIVNDSSNEVTLEVKVGDIGQTSDMTIKLDEDIIAEEHAGDFNEMVIGTNKGLTGKKLSIVAVITDTSRQTNLTSLAISLKGGLFPATFPLSKEVSEEGESVDYMALIEFFRPD